MMMQANYYRKSSSSIILLVAVWFTAANLMVLAAKPTDKYSNKYSVLSFSVHGATCAACIIEIDRLLRAVKGVRAVNVNSKSRPLKVAVVIESDQVHPRVIVQQLVTHKYQVADQLVLPYTKDTVAKYLPMPANKNDSLNDKPKLMMP